MIHPNSNSRGFTLIELMLSMAFVGALLVAIAVTSMHIMNTYSKGITIREVNQVGRTITEDLQRTIASTSPFALDSMYVNQNDIGGRLCTGSYSYVWNYGQELTKEDGTQLHNRYEDSGDRIRLVKVSDAGGALCLVPDEEVKKENAKELLAAGDRSMAVQRFDVVAGSQDEASGQALYAIKLAIGTNDQEQLSSALTCKPPNDGSGTEDFCAINQFNIIARAGNRSGSLR